jgi:hypothetical protein
MITKEMEHSWCQYIWKYIAYLQMPKIEFRSNARPSMFAYPPPLEEKKREEREKVTTAVLSIAARARRREAGRLEAGRSQRDSDKMDTVRNSRLWSLRFPWRWLWRLLLPGKLCCVVLWRVTKLSKSSRLFAPSSPETSTTLYQTAQNHISGSSDIQNFGLVSWKRSHS